VTKEASWLPCPCCCMRSHVDCTGGGVRLFLPGENSMLSGRIFWSEGRWTWEGGQW